MAHREYYCVLGRSLGLDSTDTVDISHALYKELCGMQASEGTGNKGDLSIRTRVLLTHFRGILASEPLRSGLLQPHRTPTRTATPGSSAGGSGKSVTSGRSARSQRWSGLEKPYFSISPAMSSLKAATASSEDVEAARLHQATSSVISPHYGNLLHKTWLETGQKRLEFFMLVQGPYLEGKESQLIKELVQKASNLTLLDMSTAI